MNKKASKAAFFASLVGLVLFSNCGSDDGVDAEVAPEIPPVTTFLMDFDLTSADGGRIDARTNWAYSALNVGVWNTAITITLAVPLVSFGESFNHEPSFDASIPGWVWEYDYTLGGQTYNARLEGTVTFEEVQWRMFITNDNIFSNYLWYQGTSSLDGLEGQWVLNRDPTNAVPFLQIDWNRSLDGDVAAIRYLNITPESDDNGSYIFFMADNTSDYTRSYDIFSNPLNNTTEIDWNRTNKNGRVKDPNFFEDSDFHCWDEMLEDADCP